MAYSRTTWVDRVVQFPNRFLKSGESSGGVTLTADPGTVSQAGTPLNATNLNKIEQGLVDSQQWKLSKDDGTHRVDIPAGTDIITALNPYRTCTFYSNSGALGMPSDSTSSGRGWQVAQTGIGVIIWIDSSSANKAYWGFYGPGDTSVRWHRIADNADVLFANGSKAITGPITYQGETLPQLRKNSTTGLLEYYDGTGWTPVAGVKSIQRGVVTIPSSQTSPVNVTISSVNMSKSSVNLPNYIDHAGSSVIRQFAQGYLTSATTLTFLVNNTETSPFDVRWEVIEYY